MFSQFFATRSATVVKETPAMNLHTKLATTIALYVAAIALIVPLATLSANTHTTAAQLAPAASVTAVHAVSEAAAHPTDCSLPTTCPDDATDYWAKDALVAYIAPLDPGTTITEAETGFNQTYVGTYSSQPSWGPAYVSVPSTTAANVWHVFRTIPAS